MSWETQLQNIETKLHEISSKSWANDHDIATACEYISAKLRLDEQHLENEASFIFSDMNKDHTKQAVNFLRSWIVEGKTPSLASLCIFAIQNFGIKDENLQNMILAASILGEIESDLSYHNNMHYRKVTFNMMRMIAAYNDIYEDTKRQLSTKQIATLLTAACIHDLGHDGKGNTLRGVYIAHRLEQNSYDIIEPIFKEFNVSEDILKSLHTLLICTDVTPFNDPTNTLNQMKSAYRFHFFGEKEKIQSLNLDEEIATLETSPELTTMCLMMHESDIATSAGMDYNVTKYETALLMHETSAGSARPHHILNFLNEICNRQMLSNVGQQLFAANMARIYALSEQDFHNGNLSYPRPEYSDFVLGMKEREIPVSITSDTIN